MASTTTFRLMGSLAATTAVLLAGCKLPANVAGATGPEGVVKARTPQDANGVRLLKLTRTDGQPFPDGTVLVNGRPFPIQGGQIAVSETVFQEGQRLGNLLVIAKGYAPIRLTTDAALTGVTLSPLLTLGAGLTVDAAGGRLASQDGKVAIYVPSGLLDGSASLALDAYAPSSQDALAAAYQQDLAKLYRSRGQTAPAGTTCPAPLACLPIKTALGLAVAVDASVTGTDGSGAFKVQLDLQQLMNGWDGKGEPPASWPEAQRQNAIAAATMLNAYHALDASGDTSWRSGLQGAFGMSLDGTTLTVPVTTDPATLAGGFTRVTLPGTELLGVRVEVTLTTSDVNRPYGFSADGKALEQGLALDPALDPSTIRLTTPVADPTGEKAAAVRSTVTLTGAREGSTLESGLKLALTGVPQPKTSGTTSVLIASTPANSDPATIPGEGGSLIADNGGGLVGNNGSQLISNNAGGLVSNNSGGLIANNSGGLIANNGSQVISDNGAAAVTLSGSGLTATAASGLLGNNASGLITNNGGTITGFPYLPVAPAFAKFQLLAIGVPTPPGIRKTAGGVIEYLWPEMLSVRAIDIHGNPLTEWVGTESDGGFRLHMSATTPKIFFVEASDATGQLHVYSQVSAPGTLNTIAPVDSSTTFVAVSTVHLYNFIPPERARLSGIASMFEQAQDAVEAQAKSIKDKKSPLFLALQAKVAAYAAGQDLLDARIAELDSSWAAFKPTDFSKDRIASDPVVDQALAVSNAKAPETEQIYSGLFDKASQGRIRTQSLLPITLNSPF